MALSVEQLINPVNKDQALEVVTVLMKSLGFKSPQSWESGSLPRTFLEFGAELYSDFTETLASFARAGFNDTAFGSWLELLAKSHYDNTKNSAVTTQGLYRLTAAADAPGPFALAIGELVVEHLETGFTYRSITGGTLNAGGTLDLTIEAETGGANRNVPNDTITKLVTELSGVTGTNPVSAESTWMTRVGANAETDAELQERNRTKWATLGYGGPGEAYVNWAREAYAAIKRVSVDDQNPRGAGTLDVIIAGDIGGLPPLVVTAAKNYILGLTDGVGRAPLEARQYLEVFSAEDFIITESGTVFLSSAYKDSQSKIDEIEGKLTALYSSIRIGGTKLSSSGQGSVLLSDRLKAVTTVPGVINWKPTITSDVLLTSRQVPVLVLALSYQYI